MKFRRGHVALRTVTYNRRAIGGKTHQNIGRVPLRPRLARARNAGPVIAEEAHRHGALCARQFVEQRARRWCDELAVQ